MTTIGMKTVTTTTQLGGLLLCLVLTACGNDGGSPEPAAEPLLTAKSLGEQVVLESSEYLAQSPYAGADKALGERQARVCQACHTLEAGGMNMIGPNLHGMFGRAAGSMPGFAFSEPLATAGFVWTPRALDAWLKAPAKFLPGNLMSFAGVPDEERRNALIAFLISATTTDSGEAP